MTDLITAEVQEQITTMVCAFIEELREEFDGGFYLTDSELVFINLDDALKGHWATPAEWPDIVLSKYIRAAGHLLTLRKTVSELTVNMVWAAVCELNHEVTLALEAESQQRVPVIDWRKEGF